MLSKRFYTNLIIGIFIAIVLGIMAYFYVPKIFGDIIYPLKYEEYIIKYSKEYAMDPTLVAAIIYSESHFDASVISRAGAEGLMQIMPSTAKGIAQRIGANSDFNLFDPETNIRFGTSYIRSLIDAYNGDINSALAAYNGGSGTADRYVISRSYNDIPEETANYIEKVNSAHQMYSNLYSRILSAQDVKELLFIKQEEQQKSWYEKLLERLGWKK